MSTIINILPAYYGDCILIQTLDSLGTPFTILIDGGPGVTFKAELKKALNHIKKIDLVVLTHIDSDHIGGLLNLFKSSLAQKIIFDKILINAPNLIPYSNSKEVASYSRAMEFEKIITQIFPDIKIINNLTNSEATNLVLPLGIEINILSPNKEILDILFEKWPMQDFSKEEDDDEDKLISSEIFESIELNKDLHELAKEPEPRLNIKEDIANASSLAFILTTPDFKGLFLGDSHPNIVLEGIKNLSTHTPIVFDLIKLSHHGSAYNTSNELLNFIQSQNFIISTNGSKYKHPDRKTIGRIVCHPKRVKDNINIYINYPLDIIQKKTGLLLRPNEENDFKFNLIHKNIFS